MLREPHNHHDLDQQRRGAHPGQPRPRRVVGIASLILLLVSLPLLAALLISGFHLLTPVAENVVLLIVLMVGFAIVVRSIHLDESASALDRLTRRHSRPDEWRGLLEIENAYSAPERRILLAGEFRRLAGEVLAFSPTDVARWPEPGRLAALRRQANLLLASATDGSMSFLPETMPDDPLTDEALREAIRDLARYTGQLAALSEAQAGLVPGYGGTSMGVGMHMDMEVMRVLARDHTRLEFANDQIGRLIREG